MKLFNCSTHSLASLTFKFNLSQTFSTIAELGTPNSSAVTVSIIFANSALSALVLSINVLTVFIKLSTLDGSFYLSCHKVCKSAITFNSLPFSFALAIVAVAAGSANNATSALSLNKAACASVTAP